MWAEWYRHLAERGVPPLRGLPRDVWRYRVGALRVADLTTPGHLERAGLTPPAPGRKTWPAYQAVGETLWRRGWAGLLASSAARPAGLVLCLFAAASGLPAEPVPPPTRVSEPPRAAHRNAHVSASGASRYRPDPLSGASSHTRHTSGTIRSPPYHPSPYRRRV